MTYNKARDLSETWLATVTGWITEYGEVVVVLRYLGTGARDYGMIRTTADLMRLIELCPVGTDVIAIRGRQLPLRGVIDGALIATAKTLVAPSREYLFIVEARKDASDPRLDGWCDLGHDMLEEDMLGRAGDRIAFGPCPDFMSKDDGDHISFAKGGVDGAR